MPQLPAPSTALPAAPPPHKRRRKIDFLTLAVLIAQAVLSFQFATTASVTHDEYWHLPVGILHWKSGRFDWERLNPPLARMMVSIPVIASKAPPPAAPTPPGEYGDAFVSDHSENFRSLYFRGRLMAIAISLAASIALVAWSRAEFGSIGGLLTAITWSLSPTTIAHGSIVTTDMAAVLGFVVVLRLLQKFVAMPSWKRAIAWGVTLGLAQGLKYTCVLLYPLCVVCWFLADRSSAMPRPARRTILMRLVAAIAISLVVLNATYFFRSSLSRLDTFRFQSRALSTLQQRLSGLGWLPVPFPADFLRGIDEQRIVMEQAHPVFLDGEWRTTGFRAYYLKCALYKLPLGTLALLALAIIAAIASPRDWRRSAFILFPAVSLIAFASIENMQLGIRYILPALALASLLIGRLGLRFEQPGGVRLKFAVVIAAAASPLGLRYHPYDLAYFNEYAGGPVEGIHRLVDSNLDWGQDLDGLKSWLDENPTHDLNLAYFGTVAPEVVGIRYHAPPSFAPQPGVYAISANFVAGRPHVIRNGQGGSQAVNIGEFSYLQFFRPKTIIGHSIYIYRLTEQDVQRWRNAMRAQRGLSRVDR